MVSASRRSSTRQSSRTRLLRTKVTAYSLRNQRAEAEARQRRRSHKQKANESSDASDAEAGCTLSSIGRAFALQESQNQMRSVKEKGPNTHEFHQFLDTFVFPCTFQLNVKCRQQPEDFRKSSQEASELKVALSS